jgi:hypothetical protein
LKLQGILELIISREKTMKNFILIMEAKNTTIKISVKNNIKQNCYISEASIMLDGFKNDKFQISNAESERAIYQGRMVKYHHQYVLIKPDEILTNTLDLSEAYLFPAPGEYTIVYQTYINCCLDASLTNCHDGEIIRTTTFTMITTDSTIDNQQILSGDYQRISSDESEL